MNEMNFRYAEIVVERKTFGMLEKMDVFVFCNVAGGYELGEANIYRRVCAQTI